MCCKVEVPNALSTAQYQAMALAGLGCRDRSPAPRMLPLHARTYACHIHAPTHTCPAHGCTAPHMHARIFLPPMHRHMDAPPMHTRMHGCPTSTFMGTHMPSPMHARRMTTHPPCLLNWSMFQKRLGTTAVKQLSPRLTLACPGC